jgi:hypothetical protein
MIVNETPRLHDLRQPWPLIAVFWKETQRPKRVNMLMSMGTRLNWKVKTNGSGD